VFLNQNLTHRPMPLGACKKSDSVFVGIFLNIFITFSADEYPILRMPKYILQQTIALLLPMLLLTGCLKNIKPLPSTTTLSMSWSLPMGSGEVKFDRTLETLGIPIINKDNLAILLGGATQRYFFIRDTLPFNLYQVYREASAIDLISFRIVIWNEFPVEGRSKIYFLDSRNTILDSLKDGNDYFTVPPGVVSREHVLSEGYRMYDVPFDRARIDKLQNAAQIVVDAGIMLTASISQLDFTYLDRYTLKVHLGVRVDFTVEDI